MEKQDSEESCFYFREDGYRLFLQLYPEASYASKANPNWVLLP